MCPPASLTRGLNCKGDCHVSKPSDWRYVGVAMSMYLVMEILITAVWRSRRGPAKPARKEEVVDLSSAFGVSLGLMIQTPVMLNLLLRMVKWIQRVCDVTRRCIVGAKPHAILK